MSDKSILIAVSECQIVQAIDEMCAESLPPDLHDAWEEVRECLISTRKRLDAMAPTVADIAAKIKERETPICKDQLK